MQLQNLAGSLTRLELLSSTTWVWDMLPSMPRLRSLATGCGREEPDLQSSLSNLTELRLALYYDMVTDLSQLTRLKVLPGTRVVTKAK